MSWLMLLLALAAPANGDLLAAGAERFAAAAALRQKSPADPRAAEDFRAAAECWERAAAGKTSARLEVNIGNARAFAGDLGEAVLAYRRALLQDPDETRAEQGLAAARARVGVAKAEESPSAGLFRAIFFWHEAFSYRSRQVLFALFWVLGFALLARALLRRRRPWWGAAAVLIGAALLVSLLVTDAERAGEAHAEAVLLVRTEGRSGDGEFYSPSHSAPLPAGAELTVLERRGDWLHARLRDGSTTWLPERTVTPVLP